MLADKIIALNKPAGLAVLDQDNAKSQISKSLLSMKVQGGTSVKTQLSLEQCLPQLRKHYDSPELSVMYAPDR